jgi:hypothetical protein
MKINHSKYNRRMNWVKSLKVGDVVCNCRYKHLAIKEIYPIHHYWMPWIIRQIVFSNWMPMRISDWLDGKWEQLARKLGWKELYDYTLTFTDNTCCGAFDCCSKVDDHTEEDHNSEIQFQKYDGVR